jgi:hypothetical protein
MTMNISYIMGIIGLAFGLFIAIMIYAEVDSSIHCPDAATHPDVNAECAKAKFDALAVFSLIPIIMFFAMFRLFGGSVRSLVKNFTGFVFNKKTSKKCMVFVGDREDKKTCDREAKNEYKTEVESDDGKRVTQDVFVCDRHKQVFDEFSDES